MRRFLGSIFRFIVILAVLAFGLLLLFRIKYHNDIVGLAKTQVSNATSDLINDAINVQIEIGDILAIHDTGAHGYSMGYNYNGKLRSAEVLLKEDSSFQLIRRAEKPADYFATFDFTEFKFNY